MSNIQQFTESITVSNTLKVVRYVLEGVEVDLEHFNAQDLERFILEKEPNSPKAITTICYVLGLYARWLQSQDSSSGDSLSAAVQSLDKKALWRKAKPTARKKFLSNKQFCHVIRDIGLYEEYNELYYQTLFRCIYEGIYSDDMSVLKNLRASDIHGSIVTLHEDNGHTYDLEVPSSLAADMITLSKINVWERNNRYGTCRINTRGLYADSVFKIEVRKTSSPSTEGSYKFSFYARLRKISDNYLDFRILPLQIFISGMMYRIMLALDKHDIRVNDAFADYSHDKLAYTIISNELARCNYASPIGNFREMVKGHLDCF